MLDAFIWLLAVELLGLIALPATCVLFRGLPDRGYAFGKALSILIVTFILWIAGSVHILPNTRWAIILIVLLLVVGSLALAWRRRHELKEFFSENLAIIIATEALFLSAFISMAVVRSYNPEIVNTEALKDLSILNSCLRTEYFPTHDPWLAGHSLSYYYFGHLIVATLTKLTGIASSVALNLGMTLIFALTVTGVFSIVYNLVRIMRGRFITALGFGLVGAWFVAVMGNLEALLEMFHAHGVGSAGFWNWIGIDGLDKPYNSAQWYPTDHWWWWRSSRVIGTTTETQLLDYTINEYPIWSFLLRGYLHSNLIALPFILLNLAFCLEMITTRAYLGLGWLRRNWAKLLIMAICLSSLYLINSWDIGTLTLLLIVAIVVGEYMRRGRFDLAMLRDVGIVCFLLLAAAALLSLPFHWAVQTLAEGGHFSGFGAYVGADSRYVELFIFWGAFLFITVSFVLGQAWGILRRRATSRWTVAAAVLFPLVLYLGWAIAALIQGQGFLFVLEKLGHVLPMMVVISLTLIVLIRRLASIADTRDERGKALVYALMLLVVAFLVIMCCEIFYIDDPGVGAYERLGTVFKLYFSTWVLMGVASALGLYYLTPRLRPTLVPYLTAVARRVVGFVLSRVRRSRQEEDETPASLTPDESPQAPISKIEYVRRSATTLWWLLCIFFIAGASIFALAAICHESHGEPTLDGRAFMNEYEYEAIKWLNDEVEGIPVIVEAPGSYYFDWFRVSGCTGLPVIAGYYGNAPGYLVAEGDENSEELRDARERIYRPIYEGDDIALVQELLERYNVTYVYVGELERQGYGVDVGGHFAGFMDIVFENEGVTIYKVREG